MAEHRSLTLLVADISGYTRFITDREVALAHAEQIVVDLLGAVVDHAGPPLVLHELEGDAVTLYTDWEEGPLHGSAIAAQAERMVEAFRRKSAELADSCSLCRCQACSHVGDLRLKVVVHCGDLVVNRFRQFTKIAGEPMITVHRLLKNDIEADEYILFTGRFAEHLPAAYRAELEEREQHAEGLGTLQVLVKYPAATVPGRAAESEAEAGQRRQAQVERMERHRKSRRWAWLPRPFGTRLPAFRNLDIPTTSG